MSAGLDSLLKLLGNNDLILPHFHAALLSDEWPDSYDVKIDARKHTPTLGYFHPSTHPLMGERQLYYLMHPDTRDKMIPERRTHERQMALTVGSVLHAILQAQMQMAGLVTNPKDIEWRFVNEQHKVRGRIDWIVSHPNGMRLPTEMKTCGSSTFRNLGETPKPSWEAQLQLCLDAADEDLGIVFVVETSYPFGCREFPVKRNQEMIDGFYAKFDRVMKAVADNEPPRHCCALDSPEMHKCAARGVCWLANA